MSRCERTVIQQMEKQIVKEFALENVITTSVQLPGVKVNRSKFLAESFSSTPDKIQEIIEQGPIAAGISRDELQVLAKKQILKRTSESSAASFIAGIPGGWAMAATIPADVMQFFGMALRLAQELSYLYGASDLWDGKELNEEKVQNQLLLYIGTMFGVSGAVSGVRVLTTQLSKTALKKLPQKALTKTFWYPIVKQIGKALGVRVTKSTVANGVSKIIPIVGGVVSGTLNFASMMPMANRLRATLDKACFDYSDEEFAEDIEVIEQTDENAQPEIDLSFTEKVSMGVKASSEKLAKGVKAGVKSAGAGLTNAFSKVKSSAASKKKTDIDKTLETIEKLAQMRDAGILTEEEFNYKKKELLGM